MRDWSRDRTARDGRVAAGRALAKGKAVHRDDAPKLLEALLKPGDRVCLEGDNQKQADLLAAALPQVDPSKVHDSSPATSSTSRPTWR